MFAITKFYTTFEFICFPNYKSHIVSGEGHAHVHGHGHGFMVSKES